MTKCALPCFMLQYIENFPKNLAVKMFPTREALRKKEMLAIVWWWWDGDGDGDGEEREKEKSFSADTLLLPGLYLLPSTIS